MGCFGNNPEDTAKQNAILNHCEKEPEDEERSCDWCDTDYITQESEAKDTGSYCSIQCEQEHHKDSE